MSLLGEERTRRRLCFDSTAALVDWGEEPGRSCLLLKDPAAMLSCGGLRESALGKILEVGRQATIMGCRGCVE